MATSVSQYGITWTFAADHEVGQFCTGDWYVVAPAGLTITGITPASLQDPVTGRVMHGTMVNPVAGAAVLQGFDSSSVAPYSATLNAARPGGADLGPGNPLVVPAGSSVVSSISHAQAARRPQLSDAAVLTVLAAAPAANSFRPPYCGNDKTILATESSIVWSRVPSLPSTAAVTPDLFTNVRTARPWIEIRTNWQGDQIHPTNNQPHYGRDLTRASGNDFVAALCDVPQATKRAAVIGLCQYGLDVYGAALTGATWAADGGHNMGRLAPLLFAGHVLNLSAVLARGNAATYPIFQEYQQAFYVAQIDVDITNGPTWNPDPRATLIPYDVSMIGLPEWGIRNSTLKTANNASWDATYRDINKAVWLMHALALQVLGLKDAANFPAYFDYCDRAFSIDGVPASPNTNTFTTLHAQQWVAHRSLGAPVWTSGTGGGPINEPVTITQQPQSQTTTAGQVWQFTITVTGTAPISYQWRRNGVNIVGANTNVLSSVNAVVDQSGTYDCVLTNPAGSVTTASAVLTVNAAIPPTSDIVFRKAKAPRRRIVVVPVAPSPPPPDPDPDPETPPPVGVPTLLQSPVILGLPQVDADLTFDAGLWQAATDLDVEITQTNPSAVLLPRQSVSAGDIGSISPAPNSSLTLRVWASNLIGTTSATSTVFGPIVTTGNKLVRAMAVVSVAGANPTPGRSLITWYPLGPNSLATPYTVERGYGFVGSALSTTGFNGLAKGDMRINARFGQNVGPSSTGVRVDIPGPGTYLIYAGFAGASTLTPRLAIRDGAASTAPLLASVNTVSPVSLPSSQIMDATGSLLTYDAWNTASIFGGNPIEVVVTGNALWFGRPDTSGAPQFCCLAVVRKENA